MRSVGELFAPEQAVDSSGQQQSIDAEMGNQRKILSVQLFQLIIIELDRKRIIRLIPSTVAAAPLQIEKQILRSDNTAATLLHGCACSPHLVAAVTAAAVPADARIWITQLNHGNCPRLSSKTIITHMKKAFNSIAAIPVEK